MERDLTSCSLILEFQTLPTPFTFIFYQTYDFWKRFMNTSLIIFKIPCFSVSVRKTDLIGKGIWQKRKKGWCCDENLITELELSGERGLQNKCELVFNILVINVKASARHVCTWCDCRWHISQTCYLSSLQLALFFCVCVGLFVLLGSDGGFNQESRQFINPKEGACTTLTERTWF